MTPFWQDDHPMPESVTDRPTKAHEYLFLLSKSPRYYFDADAVREPHAPPTQNRYTTVRRSVIKADPNRLLSPQSRDAPGTDYSTHTAHDPNSSGRNLRTVWTIATEPYPGAHFATFPRKLVEPCVKAGTSERGVCPECGAPWERVVERTGIPKRPDSDRTAAYKEHGLATRFNGAMTGGNTSPIVVTTGWRPSCQHTAEPVPAVVLDPFAGSGTTLLVAQSLGRRGVGIDLNPEYLRQALARNAQTPLGLVG